MVNRGMRILHLCQFLGVGGLEQVLFLLCKEQINSGHKVSLFVYDHDQRWTEKFKNVGVQIINNYQKKDGLDLCLVSIVEDMAGEFDIIHSHDLNPGIYLSLLKLKNLLKFRNFKFVHTTHGMEHIELQPKTRIYEALLGLMASTIFTVSPKFRDYYSNQILTKKTKIKLLENGTEVTPSAPKVDARTLKNKLGLTNNHLIGIYVARVVPLKGQLELIQRFNHLPIALLLVGPSGDQKYFQKCKDLAGENIKVLGSRDDIVDLLNLSDFYISHSLHEGLPISVLEAGVARKPCLLYDIPGHSQFNTELKSVELFKNISELTFERIESLTKNIEIVDNFETLISRKYSIKKMSSDIEKIYQELQC